MERENINLIASRKFQFPEITFGSLMQKMIHNVLLICSNYDAYMLEEDGRIDEQIFNEYVSLNLRYPPQFIQVSTAKKAFEEKEKEIGEEQLRKIEQILLLEKVDT